MKIKFIKPSFEVTMPMSGLDMLRHIERAGRTCYKSEDKITDASSQKFVDMIVKRGHDSVLEHCYFSVRFICDRGVSHELVRHRIASFSQESTRYVGYKDAIEFIIPSWSNMEECEFEIQDDGRFIDAPFPWNAPGIKDLGRAEPAMTEWIEQMGLSAAGYSNCLRLGWRPEQARGVLPNSLKTEIVMTANLREWRQVFKVRDHSAAHPQMRELMEPLHIKMAGMIPGVFEV